MNINRRSFLQTFGLGIASLSLGNVFSACTKVNAKPNIILIMADDLGYECIGANGGTSYQTPILDNLAKTGARFEHCYSQPLCTPSRVKIMTGIHNVRNYTQFGDMDRNQITFAQLLKKSGYATCIAGKWQLGRQPDSAQHFGFDESCLWQHTRGRTDKDGHDTRFSNPKLEINGKEMNYDNGEYSTDITSDFICDFIDRHSDTPFLAYYPMILTHCPFVPTPNSSDWDAESKGSKEYKGDAKYFGDMVSYMDKTVGKLINKLDELGIRENTLILFTGDNGTDKPVVSVMNGRDVAGGKGSMTDAGTHVPLIANWPGVVLPDNECRDIVDFSDFLPTLCETAGVTVPASLSIDGRSFLPQLKGKKGDPREWIYCWYSKSGKESEAKVFTRNQRYKLYQTGHFFDIQNDVLEKTPLKDTDLNEKTKLVKAMLQNALDINKSER